MPPRFTLETLDRTLDAADAQKQRHAREKEARHRFYEERERARREAHTRTACAFCPWEFQGTADAGVQAAREHRKSAHPELPEQSRSLRGRATSRVQGASWKEQERSRREQNRDAVIAAVKQLGDVWVSPSEIAEAVGVTSNEAGRHLRWAGYERTRVRNGNRQYWTGTGEPPTPRRICARDGCQVEFVPASNIQRFCTVSCRERSYRAR